jgi:hypothetical protein
MPERLITFLLAQHPALRTHHLPASLAVSAMAAAFVRPCCPSGPPTLPGREIKPASGCRRRRLARVPKLSCAPVHNSVEQTARTTDARPAATASRGPALPRRCQPAAGSRSRSPSRPRSTLYRPKAWHNNSRGPVLIPMPIGIGTPPPVSVRPFHSDPEGVAHNPCTAFSLGTNRHPFAEGTASPRSHPFHTALLAASRPDEVAPPSAPRRSAGSDCRRRFISFASSFHRLPGANPVSHSIPVSHRGVEQPASRPGERQPPESSLRPNRYRSVLDFHG